MSTWDGKHGVYLIAEIGSNHQGDFEYAQQLTELACRSGVDAVKFQVFTGDTLVSAIESPERHAHFNRHTLSPTQYVELAQQCQRNGVVFTASVWDAAALEWINPYVPFYKVGSGDLTAYPILEAVAAMGKPIVLSTGLATLDEVGDTVAYLRSVDARYNDPDQLALLQCTSVYPIPDAEAGLNALHLLRDTFGVRTGYSDHTASSYAAEIAVAMGAEIIEMHFTDTRDGKTFRDYEVSFTPEEIATFIERIGRIKELQGNREKRPTRLELEAGHVSSFRRGIYAVRNLSAATLIEDADLAYLRPNLGIDARDFKQVLGKRLKRDLRRFERLDWSDID